MKKLVSTVNMDKDTWRRYRQNGIGGSNSAAIIGLNPYKSAFSVYQDKISEDLLDYDNEAMRQGRDLEEYVAQRFVEETGFKVRKANAIYYREDHPHMLADFDRLIVGLKAGLECKTVSPYSADKWDSGKLPIQYFIQVQHYLGVSGFECWYVAALVFGTEFIVRKIIRNEELINKLMAAEDYFWQHNILGRNIPEPDGSDDYSELLKTQFGDVCKSELIELVNVEEDLKRREEIKDTIEKLEKEKKMIEQKVQLQLGQSGTSAGRAGGYLVSWTPTVTQRLDNSRLKSEQPEVYQKYLYTLHSKRFNVKVNEQIKVAA